MALQQIAYMFPRSLVFGSLPLTTTKTHDGFIRKSERLKISPMRHSYGVTTPYHIKTKPLLLTQYNINFFIIFGFSRK